MDFKTKVATISALVSTVSVGIGLVKDARGKWEDKTLYTASVPEGAYVYPEMLAWLNSETKTRRVKFVSTRDNLNQYYDGNGLSTVYIDGYKFKVGLEKPEPGKLSETSPMDAGSHSMFAVNVVFTTHDAKGITALEKKLKELSDKRTLESKQIDLFSLGPYGWRSQRPSPRKMDSIFLPSGVKEGLTNDLETFMASESRFETIGVPYHRGYLFFDPPGNGKTSLVAAMADQYRMNLYNMPLSAVKNDADLAENIGYIGEKSILLIEDIDIFSKSMSREQADTGPTLAGLLNALDGVTTPHGLITIMTTNNVGALDDALIRHGRVDYRLELTAPVESQITGIFEYVYDEPLNVQPKSFPSMAALSDIFKRNCNDAEAARLEIKA